MKENNKRHYPLSTVHCPLPRERRDSGHAKTFLARYADRLLFGRDTYGQDLHDFLTSLDLPADPRDAIYFKNAARLLPAKS